MEYAKHEIQISRAKIPPLTCPVGKVRGQELVREINAQTGLAALAKLLGNWPILAENRMFRLHLKIGCFGRMGRLGCQV